MNCRKCTTGKMQLSTAFVNIALPSVPDFPNISGKKTEQIVSNSPHGEAKRIGAMKCNKCGHSFSLRIPQQFKDTVVDAPQPPQIIKSPLYVAAPEKLSVKTLRKYLDDIEKAWSDDDTLYLGDFSNQAISVPHFTIGKPKDINDIPTKYQGIGPGTISYHGGMGFIIDQQDKDTK